MGSIHAAFVARPHTEGGTVTAPTAKVRALTYSRDNNMCVVCGSRYSLEWQHRQASGHGGRGRKAPALTPADGLTACTFCNAGFEAQGQDDALYYGWKVRRFCPVPVWSVPVFYRAENTWFLLNRDGSRDRLIQSEADELRALAGILPSLERTL